MATFFHVLSDAAYVAGWIALTIWALAICLILVFLAVGWAGDIRKALRSARPIGGWLQPARKAWRRLVCMARGHAVKVDLTFELASLRAIKSHCERCGDPISVKADLYHLVGGQRLAAGGTLRGKHVH